MKTINFISFITCCFVLNLNAISQNIGAVKIKGDNIYLDSLIDKILPRIILTELFLDLEFNCFQAMNASMQII